MKKELVAIRKRYLEVWRTLRPGEPGHELSTKAEGDGIHVEFEGRKYRYITSERGVYVDVKETDDPDELAYWMAIDMTGPVLSDVAGHRQWLERQAELLGAVDPSWQTRRLREVRKILERSRKPGGD